MSKKQALLAGGLGVALMSFGADALPTAYVCDVGRTIIVEGEAVVLDSAYCLDAWPNGDKPSSETERQAVYEQWGAYANWNADFVVSFDRAIAAESVSLYGQTAVFGTEWIPLPITKALAANEPICLLKEGLGQAVPYVAIAEEIVRFICGVKNLSSTNIGTTMTIELRLSDPNSTVTETLLTKTCTFCAAKTPNWFDAKIAEYISWPGDAEKADRGMWQTEEGALGDVADLETFGVLSVYAKKLAFFAESPRTLGSPVSRVVFSGDVDFGINDAGRLPVVDPAWKGGVVRVKGLDGEAYYGLVKEGIVNVWKKLEGPAPTGGTVSFSMTLRRRSGKPFINYVINGVSYGLNGAKDVPVVLTGAVRGLSFGGVGSISSLYGETESGMLMFVK